MDIAPQPPRPKRRALTHREETILRAFGELQVPYFTAEDMTRLRFPKGSASAVRSMMRGLAGGGEYVNHYLVRFGMPTLPGNFARVYTLGRRGRDFLRELGVDVPWRYRPHKASPYSYSFLTHHLSVTTVLVALHLFVRQYPQYQLVETHTGFGLAKHPPRLTLMADGRETSVSVLPDAWVYIERSAADSSTIQGFALWVEVDCGSEAKAKFQQHLLERITFVRQKGYEAFFATPSVLFCYLAVGPTMEYRLWRLHTMRTWTTAVLAAQAMDDWAAVFRFSTIDESLYDTLMLFTDPVWYRPDEDALVPLFPPLQE